ncbi:MAG: aminoacyl-tRNA hydrolase [Planctomycetales bacterium]|nr:aminoacyl-tRNA hydrolase [Planctomycetales bacterium]MCA9171720.1 aminoacyl-tRNA hydrolase [Planctomycetales bacterium]
MKLIVGLGNPGRKYQSTRHNVGYEVLARLAQQHAAGPPVGKFQGELVDYGSPSGRVLLLSPLTYMNRSGQSVRAAFDFYKLELADVIVVCDDLSLPLGRIRFRSHGSAGGQKGLADVIQRLGSDQVARLRIGIGAVPSGWDAADFVLSRFDADERGEIDQAILRAAQGLDDWVSHGIDYCMNHYNSSLS